MDGTEITPVETILRDELARGDRALRGVAPVISHMLDVSGHALVSDAIVARLRGMLNDLARQLLAAMFRGSGMDGGKGDYQAKIDGSADDLADALARDGAVLTHLYALSMEGHLTDRLQQRASLDPVLSPLLQELIASDQPAIADLAMSTLAAQSRFIQSQRRMNLPLSELPAEVFVLVLGRFKKSMGQDDPALLGEAIKVLRHSYDEGTSRLGLLSRLVSSMRSGAVAGLEIQHAGFALFSSALSSLSKQPRALAVLACHEHQAARLALSLRAAGQSADAVERQFLILEPADLSPLDIAEIPPERARLMLANDEGPDASLTSAL